ncbi:MAG: hypothetical protein FWG62_09855 [Proteobacteria bacterium]|nr:hypothetical protein [Pseudomonadota bacterium]
MPVLRWGYVDLINGIIFVESAKKGGTAARMIPIAEGGSWCFCRTRRGEDSATGIMGKVVCTTRGEGRSI